MELDSAIKCGLDDYALPQGHAELLEMAFHIFLVDLLRSSNSAHRYHFPKLITKGWDPSLIWDLVADQVDSSQCAHDVYLDQSFFRAWIADAVLLLHQMIFSNCHTAAKGYMYRGL